MKHDEPFIITVEVKFRFLETTLGVLNKHEWINILEIIAKKPTKEGVQCNHSIK